MTEQTASLLRRVAMRLYAGTLLRRVVWAVAIGFVSAAAAILATRLTGSLPLDQSRWLLIGIPAAAATLMLLVTRPPKTDRAAKHIDDEAATGDLFLTTVSLDQRGDSYEPLVTAKADREAAKIEPAKIVHPFNRLPLKWLALGLVLALAAEIFTPMLDPFGKVAIAKEVADAERQLIQDAEETKIRKAELQAAADTDSAAEEDLSPEVQAALDQLDMQMRQMKPDQKERNKSELLAARQQMSRLWEQTRDKLTKELMDKNALSQQFGGETAERHKEWKEQLQKGDPSGIASELEQIKKLLEEAAQQEGGDTPEEQQAAAEKREELMREAEQKMNDLKSFAEKEIGSEELAQAMERAMRQMDAAQNPQMSPEMTEQAIEAMKESGELSEMEVEMLAQAARDMEAIQEAIETLQEMKKMEGQNDGEFDPSECEDCETAEDYKEFYKEQMAGREGNGNGNGGDRGEREDGADVPPVPEEEPLSEGFRKEVAESFLKKGEMLMSLAGKGEGSMNEDERREFREVKRALSQEANEAIDLEDIPPGYQERIKDYFSTIEQDHPQPTPAAE